MSVMSVHGWARALIVLFHIFVQCFPTCISDKTFEALTKFVLLLFGLALASSSCCLNRILGSLISSVFVSIALSTQAVASLLFTLFFTSTMATVFPHFHSPFQPNI
jgi:hypothetical protein